MKNPLKHGSDCWHTWKALRRYPQLFSWQDAGLQISRVLLPARLAYRRAGRRLHAIARIEKVGEDVSRIVLPEWDLVFYWKGLVTDNLYFLIEQEFDPGNPHYYTTAPIRLAGDTRVFDVGACEGLFAYRLLKRRQCARVFCFEPSPEVATWLSKGALDNGVEDRLHVEAAAVGARPGPVKFLPAGHPDAMRTRPCPKEEPPDAMATTLDQFCQREGIRPTARDLIKIDAEGADFDVLKGAENLIREGYPQIAVTTYHCDDHATRMVDWLGHLQPNYRFRLKGFAHWTPRPRPVLLQAALRP